MSLIVLHAKNHYEKQLKLSLRCLKNIFDHTSSAMISWIYTDYDLVILYPEYHCVDFNLHYFKEILR